MAHQRTQSAAEIHKEPHCVSLKVLRYVPFMSGVFHPINHVFHNRLSKPSLSQQHPLPRSSPSPLPAISAAAALNYPSGDATDQFTLSPLVSRRFVFDVT